MLREGDTVIILDGKQMAYYKPGWANRMNDYIGETATVSLVYGDGCCELEEFPFVWDVNGLEIYDPEHAEECEPLGDVMALF